MKLIKICITTFKVSALAYCLSQASTAIAGSVMVCNGAGTADGYTSNGVWPNVNTNCSTGGLGAGIFESNTSGLNGDHAAIGVGMDDNGRSAGTLYLTGQKTVISSVTSLDDNQIKDLADGTLDSDAVNLGQVKASSAATLAESKAYTDTAKADAIAQGKAYTDTAKADAISESNAYTDTAKADAIAQGKAYTDTAKADAISESNAYTDTAKADAISQSNAYTDTAKADAISQSNAYTDTAKADAISQSNAYTDTAKADAISQSNAYTDTAKADAISQSNAYTDTAKADAITQGKIYTDQEVNKLSDQVIHYDLNADGTPNKNAVTLAGGSNGTTLSNVANGQVNANSKDAVNGSQLNVTNQALADYLGGGAEYNTTTQSFTAPTFKVGNANYNNVGDAVTALDYRLDGLSGQVNSLKDQLEQGLAMSAAMAGLFQPYGVGKFNVSVAGGGYGSQGAIAVGSGFRFNENTAIKAGMAAIPGKGKASYNMGVNFEW